MFKIAVLSLICFYTVNAQIPITQLGSCVTSPVIQDFDVKKVILDFFKMISSLIQTITN